MQARCVAALRPAVAGLPWHGRDIILPRLRVSLSAAAVLHKTKVWPKELFPKLDLFHLED